MSSLFKSVAKRFRITQLRTTAFHPQTNGSIERSHNVLTECLKHYISQNDWDEWLDLAMFSYNTSVHENTKFTLHELVFGRLARVSSANVTFQETRDGSYNQYLRELQTKLVTSLNRARSNLDESKNRSKSYYDRKVNVQQFSPGESVYLLNEPKKGKLAPEYTGPHLVIDTIIIMLKSCTNVNLG